MNFTNVVHKNKLHHNPNTTQTPSLAIWLRMLTIPSHPWKLLSKPKLTYTTTPLQL